MDIGINNRVSQQAFCGLFGKDKIEKVEAEGPGAKVYHTVLHYPFQKESQASVNKACRTKMADRYSVININGFGTQIHKTRVSNRRQLPFTKKQYDAYKSFSCSPEDVAKIEKALIERKLDNHLNRGVISSVRKIAYNVARTCRVVK